MELHRPPVTNEWDWGDLLDFTVDEQFPLSFDTVGDVTQPIDNPTPEVESQQFEVPDSDRVPSCEADISELKGYHRRHRVCLGCANATAVVLDGETKRYCQQCGKFHVLSDFDEGKRSCRRKLERHNNRRRRKPADSSKGSAGDKEVQGGLLTEKITCDAEASKDGLCSSSQMVEKEGLVESEDGHISALNSDPLSQNIIPNFHFLLQIVKTKSAYSSMCPTGRISFKLYDWNPAEFPRRLRHQIFQWLASMPVELEGYIRPGCTILTVFLAMPTFMWVKLLEDPESYLNDLLGSGKMLSKKGRMCVYLNNMIFNVTKDGNSVMKVNVKGRAPRLHYVHPTCFEAGKPIELVVCGSNLLQTKFRIIYQALLFYISLCDNISFAAQLQYLAHDSCVALPQVYTKGASGLHHQLYKILTHCIEPNLSGPLFIEVENESGLSNFIPVLIGDREVCSEMKIIQQRFDASRSLIIGSECEVSTMRQTAFSEFSMDIAWLLKEPSAENSQQTMTSFQIRRVNSLLNFLVTWTAQAVFFIEKLERSEVLKHHLDCPGQENCVSGSCCVSNKPESAISSEDLEQRPNGGSGATANTESIVRSRGGSPSEQRCRYETEPHQRNAKEIMWSRVSLPES
ncbi:hypothetical protein OIU84_018482 [Salix udensis]|uniref:SBP-type domain-containing protein n=1 Tax=Salix udensis TaxID=889485 RepID=A0AAD6KWU0_9ROSI|nr:hypothetical protein OIU84_018482 [Salix udensis]